MFALIDNLLDSYDKDRYMTMIHMTYKLCIILKRKFPYYRKYNGQIFWTQGFLRLYLFLI